VALAKEGRFKRVSRRLVFKRAQDYAPRIGDRDYAARNDVPWLDRFAQEVGRAVISGDVKMRRRPHEMLAMYQHGFVVVFFEAQWGRWDFFRKSSLILHWWQEIVDRLENAERGTFWVVPAAWPIEPGELRNVSLGLAQLLKDGPRVKPKRARRKRVPTPRRDGSAPEMSQGFLDGLGIRDAKAKE